MTAGGALCAALALLSPGAVASPESDPGAGTGRAQRVAVLGSVFGPGAAQDAVLVLGGPTRLQAADETADQEPDPEPVLSASASVSIPPDRNLSPAVPQGAVPPTPASRPELVGSEAGHSGVPGGVCPVGGPVSFVDTWATARSGGRTHEGTDMFATEGTPVLAVASGVVVRVDRSNEPGELGGVTVSYVTTSGDRWYNAHLSSVAAGLAVGDYLSAGQQVGSVGNTGNAATTPPHLHIEVHPDGGAAAENFALLSAWCR